MLYTRKGDNGTTKLFSCDQRLSKSSKIAEALGSVDEINSYLGVCKIKAREAGLEFGEQEASRVISLIQQDLFIIQAELAGADKHITSDKIDRLERFIDEIEKELPPISSFFVSGGVELSAIFDFARTVARRAERSVVSASEEGAQKISNETLAYLNRLSSILYALARLANIKFDIEEEKPTYN
jgi:cob(I)alamin adenosyltransferase